MFIKRQLVIMTLIIYLFPGFLLASKAPQKLTSLQERFSYGVGLKMGADIKSRGEVDKELFLKGFQDGIKGSKPLITLEEAQTAILEYQKNAIKKIAKEKRAAGEKFLSDNAKKEGVKVTASGLQYQVLKPGNGPAPGATDKVKVHYKGSLIDGQEFDSSYKRGEPAIFDVNQVIKGWTEGLQLMPVGSQYRFFIPANLAYGDQGAGRAIGPAETLIFEVELLEIIK